MSEKENPNYYAIIPANVRYCKEIPANAKLLYGEITALCNQKGYCWASNDYFAKLYGVSKTSISSWIDQLASKGYIETRKPKNIVQKLKNKNLKGHGYGGKVCVWCEISTVVLHEHHYPTPKSAGGECTVSICPNCHHEFHYVSSVIELCLPPEGISEILLLRRGD